MFWKCAVCGALDDQKDTLVNAVCHHCGKPLCQQHQVRLVDPRFGNDSENPQPTAVHCTDCKRKYHQMGCRFWVRKRDKR